MTCPETHIVNGGIAQLFSKNTHASIEIDLPTCKITCKLWGTQLPVAPELHVVLISMALSYFPFCLFNASLAYVSTVTPYNIKIIDERSQGKETWGFLLWHIF